MIILDEKKNGYDSPKVDVIKFFEKDIIVTSGNFVLGDENYDVNGSAVPFD